jgi:hypothetical protein
MHVNEQQFLQKFRQLPEDKQEEIFHMMEEIEQHAPKKPRRNPIGLCADLNISISAEEIDEVRKEMLSNFPRDDF